jgi:hypothetical protein
VERQVLNNNKTIFSLFGLNEVIVRINLYFLLGSEMLLSRRVFSDQDGPRPMLLSMGNWQIQNGFISVFGCQSASQKKENKMQ